VKKLFYATLLKKSILNRFLRKKNKKAKEEGEKQHEQATEISKNAESLVTEIEMLKVVLCLVAIRKN
jgi:hypothetical protein